MKKPTGVYKLVELPEYKALALDELLAFATSSYKYGYEYGLKVNRYLWTMILETDNVK
jgi:hypothetical protein